MRDDDLLLFLGAGGSLPARGSSLQQRLAVHLVVLRPLLVDQRLVLLPPPHRRLLSTPVRNLSRGVLQQGTKETVYLTTHSTPSFQPVLHGWCNKGCGMCYPVCGMVHIKEPLLLIVKSSLCGGSRFPFSLSEWSITICLTPYNHK